MKRLLTASIFGTILTLTGAGTANASIVSSGFLDEKLTEYALSTSLDLKANQSDFTELNTQISDSIYNLKALWNTTIGELAYDFNPNKVNNNNIDGAFSLVGGILSHSMLSLTEGWTDKNDGTTYLGVKYLNTKIGTLPSGDLPGFPGAEFLFPWLKQSLTYPTSLAELINAIYGNSETDTQGLLGSIIAGFQYDFDQDARPQYIGLIPNYELAKTANNKIGKLPSGEIRPSKGLGVLIPDTINSTYPTSIGNFMTEMYTGYWSISNLADMLYFGNGAMGQKDPTLVVKGLRQITDEIGDLPNGKNLASMISETDAKIGTLPSGDFPRFPLGDILFPSLNQPLTYPTSLAELITAIYGKPETEEGGLLAAITMGFPFDANRDGIYDGNDGYIGLVQNYQLAQNAHDKIGKLPTQISGNDTTWARYGFETPIELPTTVGGMFDMLFHDERNSTEKRFSLSTIMGRILNGSYRDDGSAVFYGLYDLTDALELGNNRENYPLVTAVKANTAAIEKIGTVPDGKNLAGMIGTLPAGYDSVGAALTAIKGIAEDAKAAALAAIPDPKQEGSSGKYVLTVDIVGDNATYHWEKIDREGEATTTTE